MPEERKIQKVFTKTHISQQKSDFEYWQTQSPQTRIDTLEEIRLEYHKWKDNGEPRLQRVITIIKLK